MSFWKDVARNFTPAGLVAPDLVATDYNQRTKQRKKEKQQSAQGRQQLRNEEAQQLINTGKPTETLLSGTEAEQQGQLAGLNLGALSYGQGLGQTGKDVQGVLQQLKSRAAQGAGDPVSAAIMGQKQAAQAQTRRNLAGTGARGTAMAGAIEAVGRNESQRIAESLYGQQRQSIADLKNTLGNIISGTTSVMQGEKAANVAMPSLPKQQEGFLSSLLSGIV